MIDDTELLLAYLRDRSESAFSDLVDRRLALVYSTALRIANGDESLAKDVTQVVFSDLARKAGMVCRRGVPVCGWLYRHAYFTATKAVRAEIRRRARELKAAAMNTTNDTPDSVWTEIAPVLDDAMNQLSVRDRDAILLRFVDQRDLRSVGEALGLSEDAAQKCVTRAIERLRKILVRRGVALPTTALATALAGSVGVSVPTGLAGTVSTAAVTTATASGAASAWSLISLAQSKVNIAGALLITGLGASALLQWQTNVHLRGEIESLGQQAALAVEAPKKNVLREEGQVDADEIDRLRREHTEVLRLRGEVARLRTEMTSRAVGGAGQPPGEYAEGNHPQETQDPAVPDHVRRALSEALWSEDPGILYPAALALAYLGRSDPSAIAALRSWAQDRKDPSVAVVTDVVRRVCPQNLTEWEREHPNVGVTFQYNERHHEPSSAGGLPSPTAETGTEVPR
jgi:RNA polymerase sigma factor (sigma-70 family)